MKRVLYPLVIAVTVAAILLLWTQRPPTTVSTVVIHPKTAVKTVLAAGKLTDRTHLQLFLRESLADTVKAGQSVLVSGAGLRKSAYAGTVSTVAEAATVQSGKTGLAAEVLLEESTTDDSVKPGLTATARITVKIFDNAVTVEDAWLIPEAETTAVYVLENGRAVCRAVTLSEQTDSGYVAAGLFENDHVLIHPETIRAHQKIKETPSE